MTYITAYGKQSIKWFHKVDEDGLYVIYAESSQASYRLLKLNTKTEL